jgi:hypothetical protein
LQSRIAAPVASRSSLTISAVIAVQFLPSMHM